METRPVITEAQAIRIALNDAARKRVIFGWPAPDCADFGAFAFSLTLALQKVTDITVRFIEMVKHSLGPDADLDLFMSAYVAVLSAPVREAAVAGWSADNRWTVINNHLRGTLLAHCDRPGRLDNIRAEIMQGVRWNG